MRVSQLGFLPCFFFVVVAVFIYTLLLTVFVFFFSRAMCISRIFLSCFCCFSFTHTLPLNVFVSFGALSLLC